jgi:hypothetical protein
VIILVIMGYDSTIDKEYTSVYEDLLFVPLNLFSKFYTYFLL